MLKLLRMSGRICMSILFNILQFRSVFIHSYIRFVDTLHLENLSMLLIKCKQYNYIWYTYIVLNIKWIHWCVKRMVAIIANSLATVNYLFAVYFDGWVINDNFCYNKIVTFKLSAKLFELSLHYRMYLCNLCVEKHVNIRFW